MESAQTHRRSLHLVHNTHSGAFVRGLTLEALKGSIREAGWEISGETDLENAEADQVLGAVSDQADAIAIAGGDGTLMAVLNAMIESGNKPALILPCGTANLLARHVHQDIDLDRVLTAARTADVKPLELGCVNGRIFAVALAAGLSPAFVRLREDMRNARFWRRLSRFPAYLGAGFRSFFERRFHIDLHDGGALRQATALYATCPDALVEEGQLLVTAGRMRSVADLAAGLALTALPGFPEAGPNWSVESRRLTVRSHRHIPVLLDGEPEMMESPLEVEFGRHSVDVIGT